MKDIVGTEIVVGSKVIFAKGGKHALHRGEVTKINAKTITRRRLYPLGWATLGG